MWHEAGIVVNICKIIRNRKVLNSLVNKQSWLIGWSSTVQVRAVEAMTLIVTRRRNGSKVCFLCVVSDLSLKKTLNIVLRNLTESFILG